jgi:hypothetical protein
MLSSDGSYPAMHWHAEDMFVDTLMALITHEHWSELDKLGLLRGAHGEQVRALYGSVTELHPSLRKSSERTPSTCSEQTRPVVSAVQATE